MSAHTPGPWILHQKDTAHETLPQVQAAIAKAHGNNAEGFA